MRCGLVPVAIAATLALAACGQAASLLPAAPRCGGTDAELCTQVSRLAIAQMNLTATGPITEVVLESVDCARTGRAYFLGDLSEARACWSVTVTGEESHGGGIVVLWPNGDLQPYW